MPKEKNTVIINQFRTISLLNSEVSIGKANFRVYGGEQLHRYIYTEKQAYRVLRMHRTHKCHKPAHQGGKHHALPKSREGDRNKMYDLPILFVMGMGI